MVSVLWRTQTEKLLSPLSCTENSYPALSCSLLCARTSFVTVALLGIEEWDNGCAPGSQNGLRLSPGPVSPQTGQLWERQLWEQ